MIAPLLSEHQTKSRTAAFGLVTARPSCSSSRRGASLGRSRVYHFTTCATSTRLVPGIRRPPPSATHARAVDERTDRSEPRSTAPADTLTAKAVPGGPEGLLDRGDKRAWSYHVSPHDACVIIQADRGEALGA
jgi:hypothetical protein